MTPHARTLGIVAEMYGARHASALYLHTSFGCVVDRLAASFSRVLLCLPVAEGPPDESRDYVLNAGNIELIPQPFYGTSLAALRHPRGILHAYARVCRDADAIFVRGMLPLVGAFYALARRYGRRPCHWIVGNPIALLRAHRRNGLVRDLLSLAYAWQDQHVARFGRRITGGAFICNGAELAALYRSPRTRTAVSSTIRPGDIYERADTCQGDTIRLLFVGFPRPEKGLGYLLEALARVQLDRPTAGNSKTSAPGWESSRASVGSAMSPTARSYSPTCGPPTFLCCPRFPRALRGC